MSKKLIITQIRPNPIGKDWGQGIAVHQKVVKENVDFRNDSRETIELNGVGLYHLIFDIQGKASWSLVMTFTGHLKPRETVRVHSGEKRPVTLLSVEDRLGADYHLFTGEDRYTWNNLQGDRPALYDSIEKDWIDETYYDPNPPDGATFVRVGEKLVLAIRRYRALS